MNAPLPTGSTGLLHRLRAEGNQSAWVLVAANAMVLAQAVFSEFGIQSVLLIYGFEMLVVGLINLPKILMAREDETSISSRIGFCLFFVVHYFGCSAVLAALLREFLLREATFQQLLTPTLMGNVALLAGSQLFAFFRDYVGRHEFERTSPDDLMLRPYGRVVVMLLAVIGGAMLLTKTRFAPAIILTIGKTIVDVALHRFDYWMSMSGETMGLLARARAERKWGKK